LLGVGEGVLSLDVIGVATVVKTESIFVNSETVGGLGTTVQMMVSSGWMILGSSRDA